jgi:hypothetical protein
MSVGDSPLAVFLVTHARAHTLFLQQLLLMRRGRYFLFWLVTSGWYLHWLWTRDDVSLPPDVSAPPTFFLGDFAHTPLCCRRLLHIWLILAYLNLAVLCLPVIFTGVCFLCPQCHLEFESHSWAAIHCNPPSSSVGLHVFLSRNLSVLSGGTGIL